MSDTIEWAAYTKPAQEHYMQIYTLTQIIVCALYTYVHYMSFIYACIGTNIARIQMLTTNNIL